MSASEIARVHHQAALDQALAEGQGADAVNRALLSRLVSDMLTRRAVADVRAELLAAADNVDPDTDYMFMRP